MQPSEQELDERSAHLAEAYSAERFERDALITVGAVREYLAGATAGEGPVLRSLDPDELFEYWPPPDAWDGPELGELLADVLVQSTHQHHPGFVGQQLSVPPPLVGPVAMVTAILNNSSAIFQGGPVNVVVERRVVEWALHTLGYGEQAGGLFTSGGTLGSLVALLAMRQAKLAGDAWSDGITERVAVLVSAEAHYCIRRACAVLGFGDRAVVTVPSDAAFRLDVAALESVRRSALDAGRRPVAVVANAGSTATGSHDDLKRIADYCAEHDLWLHVDAAHGGGALVSERYRSLLAGIERADAVVWDAHKMTAMPSLCTAVLTRERRHLDAAFRQDAPYLFGSSAAPWHDPGARSFETTKPGLVLPLYAALRTLGPAFFAEHVEYLYDLARAFADEVLGREAFELLARPESNIVCFRLAGCDDEVQLAAREAVNRSGRFFLMRAFLRGRVWLRVVLMNPLTRLGHLRELLAALESAVRM